MQQFRTRIKICGITNLIDPQVAIKAELTLWDLYFIQIANVL